MSFPRLAQRYGRSHSWKLMLNPRSNLEERVHPVMGECDPKARETYFRGWRRTIKGRVRPQRQGQMNEEPISGDEQLLGSSATDPKLLSVCQKVASHLSKVRQPQLSEFVKVGKVIGSGVEGVVRPGVEKKNIEASTCFSDLAKKIKDKTLAVKTVEKLGEKEGHVSLQKCREMTVMKELCKKEHPNVTYYLHTFESPIRYHIVTEYNQGGDLFSYLQDHDFESIPEQDAARVMMEILCGVEYVHEAGFVHLDLKLENVMRQEKGETIDAGGVRLIDFGHASKVPQEGESLKLVRPVGSPSYAAPEIVLNKTYSKKSDAWSLGVIMYIMLQGYLPFPHLQQKKWREFSWNDYGNFDKGLVENDPFYYTGDWENISADARDLCQHLLQVDSSKRLSVEEALSHPWFAKMGVKMVRTEDDLPVMEVFSSPSAGGNDTTSFTEKLFSWM